MPRSFYLISYNLLVKKYDDQKNIQETVCDFLVCIYLIKYKYQNREIKKEVLL